MVANHPKQRGRRRRRCIENGRRSSTIVTKATNIKALCTEYHEAVAGGLDRLCLLWYLLALRPDVIALVMVKHIRILFSL